MPLEGNIKSERQAGADAISAMATAIASEQAIEIVKCEWDIGEDLQHEHAHRLDIFTEMKSVRLYFPDLSLTGWEQPARRNRIEDKLRSAIAQLSARPPAATYSYS